MLRINTAICIEKLADELIEEISKNWNSPFDSPIVVFPDAKVEQWFKLRWVEKKSVLANLNCKRLERFLFETMSDNDKSKCLFTADMLRNVILAYLTQKTDGKCNYELLDEGVKNYLEKDGNLDEIRLFDFAGVIAELFIDYEISRPEVKGDDGISESFIDAWKNNKPFFLNQEGLAAYNEGWQKKLYNELFNCKNSVMKRVFNTLVSYDKRALSFYTLPELLEKEFWDPITEELDFDCKCESPVFIFGFSGVSQFHRTIIQRLAKQNDIYLYIQNPCMEFWKEDYNENDLLRSWGKAGRDNLSLWRNTDDCDFSFDTELRSSSDTSLLGNIQQLIANKTAGLNKNCEIYSDEPFKTFSVTAAPSKVREVENLHSHICRLLNGEATTDGKPATLKDILVVTPNLDDYRTAIMQVFAQSTEKAAEEQNSKEKTVLSIPFYFIDSSATNSLTVNALETLFKVREKGALSRPEFFSLVRNPVVQATRGIKPEEIAEWEKWMTEMSVFRDRISTDNKQKGWLEGVKRLLLARLSNEIIIDGDDEFSPYGNIASNDNDSLCRFIDCVESLENWLDKNAWLEKWGTDDISYEALNDVMETIFSWISIPNASKEFADETIVNRNITIAKDRFVFFFAAGSKAIPWKFVEQSLLDAADGYEYNKGSIFVGGLSFMKFAPNRTVPVKYLFFLGADAESFPGRNSENTLDLRTFCEPWPGDVETADKNRLAFLCQLMSVSEGFYLSYVDKDLQKDEDFYPSSVIADIRSFIKKYDVEQKLDSKNIWPDIKIQLDENRHWDELFTQREIRNKQTQQGFDGIAKTFEAERDKVMKVPELVKFSSFKSFLLDPFEFQANRILGISEEEEDPEKTEFEPVHAYLYDVINLRRQLLALNLGIQPNGKIIDKASLKKQAKDKGILPEGVFGEKIWLNIEAEMNLLASKVLEELPKEKYDYMNEKVMANIALPQTSLYWRLEGEAPIIAQNSYVLNIIDTSLSKSPKERAFLTAYVSALAMRNCGISKDIYIYVFYLNKDQIPEFKIVKINTQQKMATELLNIIYAKAYIEKYSDLLPVSLFEEKELTYKKFIDKFSLQGSSNPWNYFPARKIFKAEEVSGFNPVTFEKEWRDKVAEHCKLMPDLFEGGIFGQEFMAYIGENAEQEAR